MVHPRVPGPYANGRCHAHRDCDHRGVCHRHSCWCRLRLCRRGPQDRGRCTGHMRMRRRWCCFRRLRCKPRTWVVPPESPRGGASRNGVVLLVMRSFSLLSWRWIRRFLMKIIRHSCSAGIFRRKCCAETYRRDSPRENEHKK